MSNHMAKGSQRCTLICMKFREVQLLSRSLNAPLAPAHRRTLLKGLRSLCEGGGLRPSVSTGGPCRLSFNKVVNSHKQPLQRLRADALSTASHGSRSSRAVGPLSVGLDPELATVAGVGTWIHHSTTKFRVLPFTSNSISSSAIISHVCILTGLEQQIKPLAKDRSQVSHVLWGVSSGYFHCVLVPSWVS